MKYCFGGKVSPTGFAHVIEQTSVIPNFNKTGAPVQFTKHGDLFGWLTSNLTATIS